MSTRFKPRTNKPNCIKGMNSDRIVVVTTNSNMKVKNNTASSKNAEYTIRLIPFPIIGLAKPLKNDS